MKSRQPISIYAIVLLTTIAITAFPSVTNYTESNLLATLENKSPTATQPPATNESEKENCDKINDVSRPLCWLTNLMRDLHIISNE